MKFRVWDKNGNNFFGNTFEITKVPNFLYPENFVFQQFTTLKDASNKEIYEGDLLQHVSGEKMLVEVSMKEGAFGAYFTDQQFCAKHSIHACFHSFYGYAAFVVDKNKVKNFKVVGNVFENPELLK